MNSSAEKMAFRKSFAIVVLQFDDSHVYEDKKKTSLSFVFNLQFHANTLPHQSIRMRDFIQLCDSYLNSHWLLKYASCFGFAFITLEML